MLTIRGAGVEVFLSMLVRMDGIGRSVLFNLLLTDQGSPSRPLRTIYKACFLFAPSITTLLLFLTKFL